MNCGWWMGCTNGAATFWWWCPDCRRRIPGSTMIRCDFHRPQGEDAVLCGCRQWWENSSPKMVDPYDPKTLVAWLDA